MDIGVVCQLHFCRIPTKKIINDNSVLNSLFQANEKRFWLYGPGFNVIPLQAVIMTEQSGKRIIRRPGS